MYDMLSSLYIVDDPTPSQLVVDMDDNLFANILNNPHLTNFSLTKLILPMISFSDPVVTLSDCH